MKKRGTEKEIKIRCPRCKRTWFLEPNRWKNMESVIDNGKKEIHCPFCNCLIELDKRTTMKAIQSIVRGIECEQYHNIRTK